MDYEEKKKRQTIKVIITEILMGIAVAATVIALVLVVSGYWISDDFEVNRQGLLQVSSVPTGAYVTIDDEEQSWFQRTNSSKMVAVGGHNVTVAKDGYDSWSKEVEVKEGLLYRLHYPRLFLKNRKKTTALAMTNIRRASVSPKHQKMLYETEIGYYLVDLTAETLEPKLLETELIIWPEAADFDWYENGKKIGAYYEVPEKDKKDFFKFYEDKYKVIVKENIVSLYKGEDLKLILTEELGFMPKKVEVGHNGEFVIMIFDTQIATLDMEAMQVRNWELDSLDYGWIDNDMIYCITSEGELIVYDFDGFNRRIIARNVTSGQKLPVAITDDKYLYYFSADGLVREMLTE